MSSAEKETTATQGEPAVQGEKGVAQQGEIVVFDAREAAERKIAHIRRLIAEGRTVLINKVPIRTIELAKGKKSYYVLINRGQEGEMVFYIAEFTRRPVEVI